MNPHPAPVAAPAAQGSPDGGERYRILFQSLAVGVVVHAADGTIVSCNPAAERILGLTFDQMLGRTSTDPHWRAMKEDGSPFPGAEHPAMVALRTGRAIRGTVMGVARPDGRRSWISVNAEPLPSAPQGVLASFTDITRLVEAQRHAQALHDRLMLATESGGVGTVELHPHTGRAICDAVTMRLFGLEREPPGEHAAELLLDLIEPEDRARLIANIERAVKAHPDGTRLDGSLWIRWPDGTRRRLRARGVVYLDVAGLAPRLVGVFHDVTARAELDASRAAREAAERDSLAKSELLARVSHELRTPLNAILGFAQLLALRPDQPAADVRDHSERILSAGRHLTSIVSDLLDASQLETGTLSAPQAVPTSLRGLLGAVLQGSSEEAGAAGVRVATADPGPLTVLADHARLQQVLGHLVDNAIRYNRPGGSVLLRASAVGDAVRIEVADNGHGIRAEDLERIFEPFFRSRVGEVRRVDGTGLGLAICRGFVERMNGRITVRSRLGTGSVFGVTLPAAAPDPATAG
jgi:PAS domain S-box-containing protein